MRNECMHSAAVWLRWKNGLRRAWIANKKDFSTESFELHSSVSHSECRNIIQLNLATSTNVGRWIIFLLSCTRENEGPTKVVFFCTGWTSKWCRKWDYRSLVPWSPDPSDSLISWLICWTVWISVSKSVNFLFTHFSETISTSQPACR